MDFDLELYQGKDRRYFGEYDFAPVLRKAAIRHFGDLARRGQIQLLLKGPKDFDCYPGPPEICNIVARLGFCTLRVLRDGETICEQERIRLVDLLGPVLARELLELEPDETQWGFLLRQRRLLAFLIRTDGLHGKYDDERPAPEIEGSIDVDLGERRHQPFTLTPVVEEDAEPVRPEDLGIDTDSLGKLNILMSEQIYQEFMHEMPLSKRMEEGGFLLGRVSRAGDAHLIQITHVTPAHRSGAGLVHFTFTGESFLAVAKLIEERDQMEELVGWYHTHLFGVDYEMGLSSVDIDLHLTTFQRPWQVAALINIQPRRRALRFYGRGDDELTEYHQWICDDSGRYRPAPRALGDKRSE